MKHNLHVRVRTRGKQVSCPGAKFKEALTLRVVPTRGVKTAFNSLPLTVLTCN